MVLTGHCLCGAVKYTIDAEPIVVGYDHCDDCQRQSGSSYSLVVVVPAEKAKITGETKTWTGTADSGNKVDRIFCPECGSPIAHGPQKGPILAIKGGTLDTEIKKGLNPTVEIWTHGKLPFVKESLEHPFEYMPPPPS